MEFVAKRKKLKVTIEGKTVEISAPSLAQSEVLEDKLKGLSNVEVFKVYRDFLISLGITAEMLNELDADDYIDLVTFILSPKKKSNQVI